MIYNDKVSEVYVPINSENESFLYSKLKEGDQGARNTIIYSCLPLVCKIARQFQVNNKYIDLDDMIQEGNIALVKAVDNWDISKAKITTTVTYYVKNAIIDMLKKNKYKVTITKQAFIDMQKIKQCDSTNVDKIEKETGLSKKRIKQLLLIIKSKNSDASQVALKAKDESDVYNGDCLANLLDMVNDCVDNEVEKKVFLCWVKNLKVSNKTRIVAKETGVDYRDIYPIVKKVKKHLRGIASA